MSNSFCAAATRLKPGWARSKPEPSVARSFATISSLFDSVTSTSMSGYFSSNSWMMLSGAYAAPGEQAQRLGRGRSGEGRGERDRGPHP